MLIYSYVFRIRTLKVAAGRLKLVAEIFTAVSTLIALPAGPSDPGDTDSVSHVESRCTRPQFFNPTYYLMTWRYRIRWRCHSSFDLVKFGMTNATAGDANKDFIFTGSRDGYFIECQWTDVRI